MNLIVSGAFGAFNKKVVIDAGGYKNNTIWRRYGVSNETS